MFYIKVGIYYVTDIDMFMGYISNITLSKETMRTYSKELAVKIANNLNGKVFELKED